MDDQFKELARVFKALADENRLKILALIHEGELGCACTEDGCDETRCMTDLVELLGVSQATVSHHTKELVAAGLISTRKKGRWIYCQVDREGIARLSQFLGELKECGSRVLSDQARKV